MSELQFVAFEITGRCQLTCQHCYSASGPRGDHGSMTLIDWQRLINETADLAVPMVQLIGGEPTLHPDLPELVRHALGRGLQVEVFTNLVRVPDRLWEVFELPGVQLATSYYSPHASEHDSVTGRRSHDRTLDNIRSALERRIPCEWG